MSKRNPKSETPEMDDDEDPDMDSDRKDAVISNIIFQYQ